MARAIITPDGVYIEDGVKAVILPSGVFAEDQAAAGGDPDTDAQLFIAGQQQPVMQLTEIVAY